MARYALVGPNDTIVAFSDKVNPNVQTKTGYSWKLCEPGVKPSIDPLAEIVTGPTYTFGATVTEAWSKRNLTAQEISDAKDISIVGLNGGWGPLIKGLLSLHNRIRVLEGLSTHTMTQFKAGIKALL